MTNEENLFKSPYDAFEQLNISVPKEYMDNDFTINDAGKLGIQLPFVTMSFRMQFFCFVFAKRGAGSYTIDDLKFDVTPGTVFFINPGHLGKNIWTMMDEIYLITFTETFLKQNVHPDIFNEFPYLLSETINPKTFNADEFKEFENIYLQMEEESKSQSALKPKILGNLLVVLLLKIKDKFWKNYNPIYEGNKGSHIVKTFKMTLETHFRELASGKTQKQYRVSDYAAHQNLNESYLNSVIKSKTGKPISVWISEKMITEAKSLLQSSTLSVKEIAYLLGFVEVAHFSTYFKKHSGITPVDFRKSV